MSDPNTPNDTIHEAIRVVAASVGNPDENLPAATVAVEAAKALNAGESKDWRGWHALAMGLVNLNMMLLAEREDLTGEAPLDALRSFAERYPRA